MPTADQEALPFDLREVLARSEERAAHLVQRFKQEDAALEVELGDTEQRTAAASARLADAEMQRAAALAEDERLKVEEEQHLARLQAQLEEVPDVGPASGTAGPELPAPPALTTPIPGASVPEPVRAERNPDAWAAGGGEDPGWHGIGPLVYWPLIALIVIGEIPLNAFAFRLFHESDLLTYAMTVTVAVGLVAFAHVLGLLLAHPERSTQERVLIVVFVLVPLAVIGVISFVRYGYLLDVGGDAGVGRLIGTLAFGCINLLVFGAAAGLSYLHHDPRTLVNRRAASREASRERMRTERRQAKVEATRLHREQALEEEVRRREEARERERTQLEHERRKGELDLRREQTTAAMQAIRDVARERGERIADLGGIVDEARTAFGEAERRIQTIAVERRALRDSTAAAIGAERGRRDRLVFAYCSANVRARAGHVTPRCFELVQPLEVPAVFEDAMSEVA